MEGNNTKEDKKYRSDKEIDALFMKYVNTKLELYKKLTEPQVNSYIKQEWFEQIMPILNQ
ncbi:MAG: hypothetical protein H7844_13145 [Nitrospirae bacterium YQR-1]